MPDINGFAECWGISILHCPYCHGYEFKNGKTGLWGTGDLGFELSKLVSNWTKNLTLFTNGKSTLTNEQTTKIKNHSIEIVESEIEHIEHKNGLIENVICKDENKYSVKALYVKLQFKQHCDLPKNLGCEMTEQGLIKVDILQKTSVYGVYSAGDNSAWGRAVSIAIATGSVAGMSINKEMIDEEF